MRKIIFFSLLIFISLFISPVSAFQDDCERYDPEGDFTNLWEDNIRVSIVPDPDGWTGNTVLKGTTIATSTGYFLVSKNQLSSNYISYIHRRGVYSSDGVSILQLREPLTQNPIVTFNGFRADNNVKIEIIKSGSYYNLYINGALSQSKVHNGYSGDGVILAIGGGAGGYSEKGEYIDDITDGSIIGVNEYWTESVSYIPVTWSAQLMRAYPNSEYKISLYSLTNPNNAGKISEWIIPENDTLGGEEWGYISINRENTLGLNFGLYLLEMTRDGDIITDTYFFYDSLANPTGYPEALFMGTADVTMDIRDAANNGGLTSPGDGTYIYSESPSNSGIYPVTYELKNTPYSFQAELINVYGQQYVNLTPVSFSGLTNTYYVKLDGEPVSESPAHSSLSWVSNAIDGEIVTIGDESYEFNSSEGVSPGSFPVQIGSSPAQTFQNLEQAINSNSNLVTAYFTQSPLYVVSLPTGELSGVSSDGGYVVLPSVFAPVNCTGLTQENGYLIADIKCNATENLDPDIISQIEVSSASIEDQEEWVLSQNISMFTDSYTTFCFPFSDALAPMWWETSNLSTSDIIRIRGYVKTLSGSSDTEYALNNIRIASTSHISDSSISHYYISLSSKDISNNLNGLELNNSCRGASSKQSTLAGGSGSSISSSTWNYEITDWTNFSSHIFTFSPDLTKPGVYGYVRDLSSKAGVYGAIVTISNNTFSQSLSTDETGFYYLSFPLVSGETYTIHAMKGGYASSVYFSVSTVESSTTRKDLYLEKTLSDGEGVYYASHDVSFTVLEYWYSSTGLPGVSYAVYDDENESVKNGTTGSKGTFTVKDMDAGKNYTFILNYNGSTYTEYIEPGLTEYTLVLNKEGIVHQYFNPWLNLTYAETPDNVTVHYTSSKAVSEASLTVTASNGSQVQANSLNTTSGSFLFSKAEGDYILQFNIEASDGSTASQAWSISSPPEVNLFPDSYPTWLKNTLFVAIIIIFLLAFGKSKNDIACGSVAVLTSFGYYFEWLSCSFNFVVLVWIIAIGAIFLHYKRTGAVG